MSTPKLVVAHPGRQHSHQLAAALHREGLLEKYWTGVPVRKGPGATPLARLLARFSPPDLMPIPAGRVRHCFRGSLPRKLAGYVMPAQWVVFWGHLGNMWFDRWCARRLARTAADAVICYENSALETFKSAKRQGLTTILDAASVHHAWQDRHYDYVESDRTHRMITRQKDEEIALADHIFTVSELARESYLKGGAAPERVSSVPLGCDLSRFKPASAPAGGQEGETFTFVFAGYASARKGVDVLLKAAEELQKKDVPCRIICAGRTDETLPWMKHANVERVGLLPQEELARLFQRSDCLVLPSRHDSFGMVVVEAMATGLPVLLSDQVGSKEIVQEGETGWIVPVEDAGALADRMRWCARHRDEVAGMGRKTREAAKGYSWEAYHQRVIKQIRHVLDAEAQTADHVKSET